MFEINGITYAGSRNEMMKITDAHITGHMMMLITFSTGEQRVFDATALNGEVFEPLNDESVFQNFQIVHGTLTWMNEEIDIAPEYIYDNSFSYNSMLA